MSIRPWVRVVGIGAALFASPPSAGSGQEDVTPERFHESVLARALENSHPSRFERLRLTNFMRGQRGLTWEIEVWVKGVENQFKVVGLFGGRSSVRGTGFLVIPSGGQETGEIAPNQYFMYLPSLRKVKRISGAQRGDSFFGTQLSQGDVETHPIHHYRTISISERTERGEAVWDVVAAPRFESGYERVVFSIAQSDYAFLRIEQFVDQEEEPIKVIEVHREWLKAFDGHVLPTKLVAMDGKGIRSTDVEFYDRSLRSDIPDNIFTTSYLTRSSR